MGGFFGPYARRFADGGVVEGDPSASPGFFSQLHNFVNGIGSGFDTPNPRAAALMGIGAAMSKAAGPSRLPVSLAGVIGSAGEGAIAGQSQGFAQQNQQAQTKLTQQQSDMFRQQLAGMTKMQDLLYPQGSAPPGGAPMGQTPSAGAPSVMDAANSGVDTAQPGWYLRPGAVSPSYGNTPNASAPRAPQGPAPIVDPATAIQLARIGAAYGDKNYNAWLDFGKAAPGFQYLQDGTQRYVPGGSADPSILARQKFAEVTGTKTAEQPFSVTEIKPGGAAVPTSTITGTGPDQFGLRIPTPSSIAPPSSQGQFPAPTPGPSAGSLGSQGGGGGAAIAGSPAVGIQRLPGGGFMNTASPALVNLTQGQTPAYNEAVGKDVAKFITDKQMAIQGAQQSLKAVGDLRTALEGLPTGPGTESVNDAASFMQKFGVDLNKVLPAGWQTDPTKSAVAMKNITQLATAYAKGEFPTRITNNDMAIALQATPNFWNNPAANKQLLDNLESVQRVKIEEARFYRQEAAKFKPGTSPDWTILDKWDDHLQGLKGVPDTIKRSYMSFSELNAHPDMGGDKPMNLPKGAVNYASGPNGVKGFIYPKPGGGFFVGDEQGNPYK